VTETENHRIWANRSAPLRRGAKPTVTQMSTICFRVTRSCNLSCSYCQAPPNSKQLSERDLLDVLAWFAGKGTRRIKFTGGEPFVYRGILNLIEGCRSMSMEPTIITNGTHLPQGAIECLITQRARVKVSLHGPRDLHDAIQGAGLYERTLRTLRLLISAGIETSVHTLLYRDNTLDLEKWIAFLAEEGVHKVSFMAFVPRGRGQSLRREWQLSSATSSYLGQRIGDLAELYEGRIVVRYLDFVNMAYLVFETDGQLVWQIGDGSADSYLASVSPVGLKVPQRLVLTREGASPQKDASPSVAMQGLGPRKSKTME
jgi:MoaA/NifB/PqqE/SkfB family radical SAM enzyme